MNGKKIYITATVVLLMISGIFFSFAEPKKNRIQQHLTYNTQVADTSLSIDAASFSSHLPVLSIDTGGKVIPGKPEADQHVSSMKDELLDAGIKIISRENELNTLQGPPDTEQKIKIRVRGNSSRKFDKNGYLFKFLDDKNEEKALPLLGMEENATWVLHGPYVDKTLMRNYMWQNLSGQIMDWSPDVRFCEVFLNNQYQGIYVLMEQISVGEGRVEVSKYDGKSDVSSYIVCIDRESVNDTAYIQNFSRYTMRLRQRLEVKYPGPRRLPPALESYIGSDISKFEKSLYSYDYDTRQYGYRNFIDTDSFVDYFLINEIAQNTDAGIFSTYLYKDVGGKLKLAVWDFNNCADNYIEAATPVGGFFMDNRIWYLMLLKDERFTEKIISRYSSLRKDILSDASVKSYIHDVRAYLGTAVDRNYLKWGAGFLSENDLLTGKDRGIASYDEAIIQYENRLLDRMHWLDKHIDILRSYSHESVNKNFNH